MLVDDMTKWAILNIAYPNIWSFWWQIIQESEVRGNLKYSFNLNPGLYGVD